MSLIGMAQEKKQMRGPANLHILPISKHWLRPDTLKYLPSPLLCPFPPNNDLSAQTDSEICVMSATLSDLIP